MRFAGGDGFKQSPKLTDGWDGFLKSPAYTHGQQHHVRYGEETPRCRANGAVAAAYNVLSILLQFLSPSAPRR